MTSPNQFAFLPVPIEDINDIEYINWMVQKEHPGSARALSAQWHELGNSLYRVMLDVNGAKLSLSEWESPEAYDAYETRSDGVHRHALDLRNAAHDIGSALTDLANVMEAGKERMQGLYDEYNSSMSTWDGIVRRNLDSAGMEFIPVDEASGHYTLTIDPDGELWTFEEGSLVGNGDNYSAGDRGTYQALWAAKVKSVAWEIIDTYIPGLSKLNNTFIWESTPYDYVFHPGSYGIDIPDPGGINPGTVPAPPPPATPVPPGGPGAGLVNPGDLAAPPAGIVGVAPLVNPAAPPGANTGVVQPLTTPAPPGAPGVETPPVPAPPAAPGFGLMNLPAGSTLTSPGSQQVTAPPPPSPGTLSTNLDTTASVLSNGPALDPTGQPLPPGSFLSSDVGAPPGATGLSVSGHGADPPNTSTLSATAGMPPGGMGMGMPPGATAPPAAPGSKAAQRNPRGSAPPGTGVGAVPGAAGDGTLPPGTGVGAPPGTGTGRGPGRTGSRSPGAGMGGPPGAGMGAPPPGNAAQRRQPGSTPTAGTGTPSPGVPEAFLPPTAGAPPVLGDPQQRRARPGSAAEAPRVARAAGRRGVGGGTPPVLVNKHHTGPRPTYTEQRAAEKVARRERVQRFKEILKSALAKDLPEGTAPVLDGRLPADGVRPERAAEVPAALRGAQPVTAADPHARPVPPADQASRRLVTEQPAAPAEATGPATWEVETPGGPVVSGEPGPKRPEQPTPGTVRPG